MPSHIFSRDPIKVPSLQTENRLIQTEIPAPGTKELLQLFKYGYSVALMIDQRVSEGIKSKLFGRHALTTTIPAQLVKKYKVEVVPVYIERKNNINFKMYINKPILFKENDTLEKITDDLNSELEKMILNNPDQWIWSHDRWK